MFPMLKYREKHPTNLVLLGVFTLCCSLSIAMTTSTSFGTASRFRHHLHFPCLRFLL